MQKITPCLWFDHQAEEAAKFYVSLFKGNPEKTSGRTKILGINRYDKSGAKASGQPEGSVLTVSFELDGQEFLGLNGGNFFKFSGAVSFIINCKTQKEVDYFWKKLGQGGETGICGWINRDKFGVTWQVVPTALSKLLSDPNPVKSERVMKAMLKMSKIIIADLKQAYKG